jgi:hypothetical protein
MIVVHVRADCGLQPKVSLTDRKLGRRQTVAPRQQIKAIQQEVE